MKTGAFACACLIIVLQQPLPAMGQVHHAQPPVTGRGCDGCAALPRLVLPGCMLEPLWFVFEFMVPDFVVSILPECDFEEWVPPWVMDLPPPIVLFEPAGAGAVAPWVVGLFSGAALESLGLSEGAPAAKAEPVASNAPVIIAEAK